MNKKIKLLISIILFALLIQKSHGLQFSSIAYAASDITINWGVPNGQPLFLVNNFLPGDFEKRTVSVFNNSPITQPIAVRAIKTDEISALGGVLEITISQNGSDLYGGTLGIKTLTQFFLDGGSSNGLFLINLDYDKTADIDFKVKFKESAGNSYQNSKVVFDLIIGTSSPAPEACRNIRFDKIINGTSRNDVLHGTNGNDLIFGVEGNDIIDGSNGNDCLVGGLGNDRVFGNNGNDFIFGNEGNDYLDGSNGNDYIEGNDGNDILIGSNGLDILIGGNGFDFSFGGNGKDKCEAEIKSSCEK